MRLLNELPLVLKKEQPRQKVQAENTTLKTCVFSISGFDQLIGKSAAMLPVFDLILVA